jgi:hypothetical protein
LFVRPCCRRRQARLSQLSQLTAGCTASIHTNFKTPAADNMTPETLEAAKQLAYEAVAVAAGVKPSRKRRAATHPNEEQLLCLLALAAEVAVLRWLKHNGHREAGCLGRARHLIELGAVSKTEYTGRVRVAGVLCVHVCWLACLQLSRVAQGFNTAACVLLHRCRHHAAPAACAVHTYAALTEAEPLPKLLAARGINNLLTRRVEWQPWVEGKTAAAQAPAVQAGQAEWLAMPTTLFGSKGLRAVKRQLQQLLAGTPGSAASSKSSSSISSSFSSSLSSTSVAASDAAASDAPPDAKPAELCHLHPGQQPHLQPAASWSPSVGLRAAASGAAGLQVSWTTEEAWPVCQASARSR